MFLRVCAFTISTLFAAPVAAQCLGESYFDTMSAAQRAALDAQVADMPYAEGLTYEATRGDDRLVIVGTMHIYDPRLEIIRARIIEEVRNADLVMLEATAKEEQQLQEMISRNPELIFIVDGPTLPERLDEETWQMILAAAAERNIPSFMAAKMQPWYLSLMIAIPTCAMGDMLNGAQGLDKMIAADARAAGVPRQAVEPYTTLFSLFEDAPVEEQIDMLRVNMLSPDLQRGMFVAMLDRYFAEDVGRLWEMGRIAMADLPNVSPEEGMAMFDEMEESLLKTRNRNWIPVITEATEAYDNIVVAVGAGHLIGQEGVLQLLENEGWQITRFP
ncbi:TraB/GumN family protein [Yoonia litorea]|uniref:TraB family protein n=1 Tax=Yoonia litorea TaxID=1123755 RepID=A0A1I6MX63_9RHOB|nr:TraB/GumN family protein [Yoonia litorea]SFS20303.1 hypothetical protein SAMN05444714_2573 [Yoonia litorea]